MKNNITNVFWICFFTCFELDVSHAFEVYLEMFLICVGICFVRLFDMYCIMLYVYFECLLDTCFGYLWNVCAQY